MIELENNHTTTNERIILRLSRSPQHQKSLYRLRQRQFQAITTVVVVLMFGHGMSYSQTFSSTPKFTFGVPNKLSPLQSPNGFPSSLTSPQTTVAPSGSINNPDKIAYYIPSRLNELQTVYDSNFLLEREKDRLTALWIKLQSDYETDKNPQILMAGISKIQISVREIISVNRSALDSISRSLQARSPQSYLYSLPYSRDYIDFYIRRTKAAYTVGVSNPIARRMGEQRGTDEAIHTMLLAFIGYHEYYLYFSRVILNDMKQFCSDESVCN